MIKILMVDDVKFSIEIGKSFLDGKGCEILSAGSGAEGFALAVKERPDLVLTDLFMPGMHGDDLCRKLKETPETKNIPVIILTAADKPENQERCLDAGCDGILGKPYSKGDLIEVVKRYISILCRKDKRVHVDFEVSFDCGGSVCDGKVIDVSQSGMFVQVEKRLPLGAEAFFALDVSGRRGEMTVRGEVVRLVPDGSKNTYDGEPGMGIRFKDPTPEFRSALEEVVSSK